MRWSSVSDALPVDDRLLCGPAVQVEGCYVMAAGMCLSEQQTRAADDRRLLSYGTWDLKIPSVMDIPVQLNVSLTQTANTASRSARNRPFLSADVRHMMCFRVAATCWAPNRPQSQGW